MDEPRKRFKRAQKAAELRSKELEAEKFDYPIPYMSIPKNFIDEEDGYPFAKVSITEFDSDDELLTYVEELILDGETS